MHSQFPSLTPQTSAFFGNDVAMDNDFYVVGAFRADANGIADVGMASVYNVATGALVSTLHNPSPDAGDEFGISVAVSGNLVVVGSYYDDTGATNSGMAYVFNATTGALVATLNNPSPADQDEFGISVAISGNLAVVGAYVDDTGAFNSGTAYLFDATTGAFIRTFNNPTPAPNDGFGLSVAISGNVFVVGAYQDDTGTNDAGSAYIFDATTGGLLATLNNPTPQFQDWFGAGVAVSGNTVLVAAMRDNTGAVDAGSAYQFDATTGALIRTLNNPNPVAGDFFSSDIGISGNLIVLGSHGNDVGATDAGATYLFNASSGALVAMIKNPTPESGDYFGAYVALSGGKVVVGAHQDDTFATNMGAAYVYSTLAGVNTVQVNDGSAQRSRVTSLSVTFDTPVNLPSTPADAFQLTRTVPGGSASIPISVDLSMSTPTQTIAKLTFAGPATEATSLIDGNYSLQVFGNQVTDMLGQLLDGDANGSPGGDHTLSFHRLFGDANGDRQVTAIDYAAFRLAYGQMNAMTFDVDGDGLISTTDFLAFRLSYGAMLLP